MLQQMRRPWPPPFATSTSFLLPLFLLISVLVSLLPPSSCDEEPAGSEYNQCEKTPLSCGSRTINVSYPFKDVSYPFKDDETKPYCGHRYFELRCNSQNTSVVIEIQGERYQVKDDIDYDQHNLTLVYQYSDGKSCSKPNSDKDFGPFFIPHSGQAVQVTIWECFCPVDRLLSLQCSSGAATSHMYFWPNKSIPTDIPGLRENCHRPWHVWMDKSAVEQMKARSITYEGALLMGFNVTWTLEDWNCSGHDTLHDCIHCEPLAPPPLREPLAPPPLHRGRRTGIIIGGTCAGAVGLILVCLVGVFFYRRQKRARGSGGLLSQTTSSFYPGSKMDTEMFSDQGPHTQIFQYEELHEATDGFSSANELGEGGFGTVYKGNLADGRTVAIKRLHENNYRQVEQFRTEVSILSSLRHPNLVSLYGCTSRHSRELILVYEYVPNGTVADHIHGPRASGDGLPWPIRMNIAIETATALSYLHSVSPQIIHRDVKTNNILLDNYFQVKVADFGLSRLFPLNTTHISTAPQGTPGYVDPEYRECYQLTDKSDVYSFGVVLVELISSKPAVDITRPRHEINLASLALRNIQSDQLDQLVDPKLWHQTKNEVVWMVNHVAELAFRCLQEDSELRPTMGEVADALRAIDSEARGRAKGATAHGGMNDDACLLQSSRSQSPDTVNTKWSNTSTKTTPNSSG